MSRRDIRTPGAGWGSRTSDGGAGRRSRGRGRRPVAPAALLERLEARRLLAADLSTSMTLTGPTDPSFYVGQDLTYVVTVSNVGNTDAADVTLLDTLPSRVVVQSFNASAGTVVQLSGGQVRLSLPTLATGASETLTLVVTPLTTAAGQDLTNTATASLAAGPDPTPGNDTASLTTRIDPAADLGVTIAASPSVVLVGQDVTYTVNVSNFGPNNSTGASLEVDLPSGVVFRAGSSTGGLVYDSTNNRVTLALPAINSGSSVQPAVQVVVQATPASGTSLPATARVIAGNEGDLNPANDQASSSASASDAVDLGVSISDSPDPVFVGRDLTYTVVVTNGGPSQAHDAQLSVTLPAGVTYQTSSTTLGSITPPSGGSSVLTVDFATLDAGQSATVTIVVRPVSAAPGGTLITANAAVVASSGQTDRQTSNNTASQQTTVNPLVNISIAAQALDPVTQQPVDSVLVRGRLLYRILVSNSGPSDATGVVITSLLPAGVAVVPGSLTATPSANSTNVGQSAVEVRYNTLAAGDSAAIEYLVDVQPTTTTSGRVLTSAASVRTVETDELLNNTVTTPPIDVRALDVGAFRIEFPDYSVAELAATGRLDVRVVRVGGSEGPQVDPLDPNGTVGTVGVRISTADLNAIAGLNYGAIDRVLTFDVGQTSQTVSIPIYDDLTIRRDLAGLLIDRQFALNLTDPTDGAALLEGVSPTSTATIQEGDFLTVNRLDDATRPQDVPNDSGPSLPAPGTLRYAITVANNTPNLASGPDTIPFNVPSVTPVVIQPGSALPAITEAARLDGNQQPGFAGAPVVRIDGQGSLGLGLVLAATAGGSGVQGLSITGFTDAGLLIQGSNNVVRGNFLGLDPAGAAAGNGDGLRIEGGSGNAIGGVNASDRNVISANTGDGIRLVAASGTLIRGNFVGTSATGQIAAGLGPYPLGNAAGIVLVGASDDNLIGAGPLATDPSAGNRIANNNGPGVGYEGASGVFGARNLVRLNSIDANVGLGIDFGGAPSVPAVPVIIGAASAAGVTSVQGYLDARPLTHYLIDVYSSPVADPSGSGEGRMYLGTVAIDTDSTGRGTFAETFSVAASAGSVATATATLDDPSAPPAEATPGTSMFSGAINVTGGLTVTNTLDSGAGSLRDVLAIANAAPTAVIITFAIPASDPGFAAGVFVIQPLSPLPAFANPLGIFLDATTQTAETGNTNPNGPEVVLDGGLAGPGTDGLTIPTDANAVSGLVIQNFAGAGVALTHRVEDGVLFGASRNRLGFLYLGVGPDGQTAAGNGGDGVRVEGGSANSIGGAAGSGQRLLIGGNAGAGVNVKPYIDSTGSLSPQGSLVQGAYLGVGLDGVTAIGNGVGVRVEGGVGNLVGGNDPSVANVISGNTGAGVLLVGSVETTVAGNRIGTTADGTAALANGGDGVRVEGGSGSSIGGLASGAGNLIAGNAGAGVVLTSATAGNLVAGDRIGLNGSDAAIANQGGGVLIDGGATANQVGQADPRARNVLSGNALFGVRIAGAGTSGNVVAGNGIGTVADGSAALANAGPGVVIDGAAGNVVGGLAEGAGNLISGNDGYGLSILGGAAGNFAFGNRIGTDADGQGRLGNAVGGVLISDASANAIGGPSLAQRNVISGNSGPGVRLDTGSTGNTVAGNLIGLARDGNRRLGNLADGVQVEGASGNLIGGTSPGAGNAITANVGDGVAILDASDNVAAGNLIGTDATGGAIASPPTGQPGGGRQVDGVSIRGNSAGNLVGGTTAGARNVIADGSGYGVRVEGAGVTGTVVQTNLIGTSANGGGALGFDLGGILVSDAPQTQIGGDSASLGNRIANNLGAGVVLTGGGQTLVRWNVVGQNRVGLLVDADARILDNLIGTDLPGVGSLGGNLGAGVVVTSGAGVQLGGNQILDTRAVDPTSDDTSLHGVGLLLRGSAGVLADGNTIAENAAEGIVVTSGADGVTLRGNTIRDNGAAGVLATSEPGGPTAPIGDLSLLGNQIGTDAAGSIDRGNAGDGVDLRGVLRAVIRGNTISGNAGDGLVLESATSANIQGNQVGTDAAGMAPLRNDGAGVRLVGSTSTTIGGTTGGAVGVRDGNTISGNGGGGIVVDGGTGTTIVGNNIGLNASGDGVVPGVGDGILLIGNAQDVTIGGTGPAQANRIGGNRAGVHTESATGVSIVGNLIGLGGANGDIALGNSAEGILSETKPSTIGLSIVSNVVSANGRGIVILGNIYRQRTVITDNYVGTDRSGQLARGNAGDGIYLYYLIDGTFARNVVSANGGNGIAVRSSGALVSGGYLDLTGNTVGLSADGQVPLGNGGAGIRVQYGASVRVLDNQVGSNRDAGVMLVDAAGTTIDRNTIRDNDSGVEIDGISYLITVGGTASGSGNRILGNRRDGIAIVPASGQNGPTVPNHVTIVGNFIGLDEQGQAAPNGRDGIRVEGGTDNTIGTPTAGNTIVANQGNGVALLAGASGNRVEGNLIGVAAASGGGYLRLGNLRSGVSVEDSPRNTVVGNLIGDNRGDGVSILNNVGAGGTVAMAATGNVVTANRIGIDPTATTVDAANLANVGNGVSITNARGNTIGGLSSADQGNQIAFNNRSGIFLTETVDPGVAIAAGKVYNIVGWNQVGVDLDSAAARNATKGGEADLGNKGDGVAIVQSPGNLVVANTILGNNNGVFINQARAAGNRVVYNWIGAVGEASPLGPGHDPQNLGNRANGVAIIDAAGTTLEANTIGSNLAAGVQVAASADGRADGTRLTNNYVGTNSGLAAGLGNRGVGVALERASNTTIGVGGSNVIAGNASHGILIAGKSTGTRVEGNRIGMDGGLGNALDGVFVTNSTGNSIGGRAPSARNVITGNGQGGVAVVASPGTSVVNNQIGRPASPGVDPQATPGNSGDGVVVADTTDASRPVAVLDNVIAGNTGNGVVISNSSSVVAAGNTIGRNVSAGVIVIGGGSNRLEYNGIGTDLATGTVALGNLGDGVVLFNSMNNLVTINKISANRGHGVRVEHSPPPGGGTPPDGSRVVGNFLGVDPGQTRGDLGNALNGVLVYNAAYVRVADNVSAFNLGDGVGGTDAEGLEVFGNDVFANAQDGVRLTGRTSATVGGADGTGRRNRIAYNGGAGVEVNGQAARALLVGNYVGVGLDQPGIDRNNRPATLANNAVGIYLTDAAGVRVGAPGLGNVISGNDGPGIQVYGINGAGGGGNLIQGNLIGTDSTGTRAASLTGSTSEVRTGVTVIDSPDNLIGGTDAGAGNVISGNDFAGISIFGVGAVRNRIEGNIIGGALGGGLLGPAPEMGADAAAFQDVGVLINAVSQNTIGGANPAARNFIEGNLAGVHLVGVDPRNVDGRAPGDTVQNNTIDRNETGVYLNGSSNHLILGNEIRANNSVGISLARAASSGNTIQGNTIADTRPINPPATPNSQGVGTGIFLQGARNNVIGLPRPIGRALPPAPGQGNTFFGNGGVDIYMTEGATGNSVRGNTFQGSASAYGVLLYNSTGNLDDVVMPGQGVDANRFPPNGQGPRIANLRVYNARIDGGVPGTTQQNGVGSGITNAGGRRATPAGPAARFRASRLARR